MRQCRVVGWGEGFVTIAYVGGTVDVRLGNVAPADRMMLENARNNARDLAAYQAMKEKRGEQPSAISSNSFTPAPTSALSEEQQEAIKHGVFYHELVAGMTEAQVIECMGATPTEKFGGGSLWQYERRGKGFKNPNYPDLGVKDRWLTFSNGLLVSWRDS